ncbi:hypothetical protein [Sedimentitalea xiamensis]|nr:hypothetical protein [Sedimentitalea xiamensis]
MLAVASGAMIGFGVPTGTGWAWKLGLGGVVLSVVLLFILTRSIERRLWAVFFTFMAGAAGSLAAPVYSFTAAARVGDPAAGTGAEGSGMMSSGGSIATTLLWFLGAVIAAWLARQERRK